MNKEKCIKALEYTEERYREVPILDSAGLNISEMCSDILNVLENCIEIPEDATNGYMVKAMFPDARVSQIFPTFNDGDEILYVTIEKVPFMTNELRVSRSWWDAPFKKKSRQGLAYADQETMMPAT